ncbi:aldehyde dehydrogenase [Pseudonocardia sp. RS010]|uniref:aldehyde dehydrogenase n=1 Tax=Pseudonocardia sp. RS010 TaxID=3385979 RepID=UPI0039A11BB9
MPATPTSESLLGDRPQVFVGGRWTTPSDGATVRITNPATREHLGDAALGTVAEMDAAVAAARTSFDSGVWSRATPAERAAVLHKAADLLEQRLPTLSDGLTRELGCPLWFSRAAHASNAFRHLRYYAALIESMEFAETRRDESGATSVVTQEPVGVVAAITPWNSPLSNPMMKLSPALAAGCSAILKPPPDTPLSGYALAEALADAGLPDGVLSVVPADRQVGEYLVAHREVDKVSFTGSTAAGKKIMAACADRVARVTLELGGKSAAIVLDDADPAEVIPAVLPMSLMLAGQACIAQTRILLPRSRYAEFVDALAQGMRELVVGDPLDDATTIGPLVNDRQRDRVEGYLATGRAEGARLVVGGGRPRLAGDLAAGCFVEPTLFAEVDNRMRIAQEEIFGPVLVAIPYDGDEEGVQLANDTVYGLAGSVWSTDDDRALRIAGRMRTGMVSVNGHRQAYGSPLGGFKQSGMGRELGPEGIRPYLEPKSVAVGAGR